MVMDAGDKFLSALAVAVLTMLLTRSMILSLGALFASLLFLAVRK